MNSAVAQVPAKFQRALACHQRGELAQAKGLYQEILALEPAHADALHLLGVIAGQSKEFEVAAELIGKAVSIDPQNAAAHSNLGAALKELKQLDAALESYERAIAIRSDNPVAHYNRGNLLKELGQPDAALASYDQAIAIRPRYAEAHYNRALVLRDLKQFDRALASYDRAIETNPAYAEAYHNRGALLQELRQIESALANYDKALLLKPDYADAHSNRGLALKELRQFDAALASYARAIALRPDCAETHCNRGAVLNELREFEAALASFDQAIALKPRCAEAYTSRGVVLKELGRVDEALASHDQAIAIEPGYAAAHSNRGVLLHELNRLDAALASYDQAIAMTPDFAQAHENRAYTLLLRGDLEDGWEDYEWRWRNESRSGYLRLRNFSSPRWLGEESLQGKTILLHGEQGLGDEIQFCRYVKCVADLGATVILEVAGPLQRLLESLAGVSQVIARGRALPHFDLHCPLMSLPLAFKTTLSSLPAQVPYLRSPADKLLYWKEKLGQKTKLRVGLVWSGGFRADQPELWSVNSRRNIPLAKLAALRHADIEFYSLQKGQPAESELAELNAQNWDGPRLKDFTAELNDFSDTAALIEQLDLVIAVDTSTAHLAGALARPVWILNRFDTCWRWLLGRTDSPWYPTARLYRQETAGDWAPVLRAVRSDLIHLASSAHPATP